MSSITRRDLLAGLACSTVGLSSTNVTDKGRGRLGSHKQAGQAPASPRPDGFLEILRPPDLVTAYEGLEHPLPLTRNGDRWQRDAITVRIEVGPMPARISLSAPGRRPTHVHVRWNLPVAANLLVLGDHWERSYGDLRWSSLVPERVMPWYFLTTDGESLHGYGVETRAGALCFWQLDPDGVSLWLNVCNGGAGVELGDRDLLAALVVSRRGARGEDPMLAATAFCLTMCLVARLEVPRVLYGSNDWYYAYGKNTADQIVRDAELMASVAPAKGERPFTVIDDGWQNAKTFPDMPGLAQAIRERGVRPGLWIRPLQAPRDADPALLLPQERFGPRSNRRAPAYDPTIPAALDRVLAKVKQATAWGYELVKHDYTTFELFGQWGFEMKAQPTLPGWNFHDRSRTNAEIVHDLYVAIRRTAGDRTILIGCNTIGHLAATRVHVQRTGDDTSGTAWERTRRMGVNTLACRLPQNRTFFLLDADCVPITKATPWAGNRQWLDLVARSGTALFVSPEPSAIGDEQRRALRDAFEIAASTEHEARPLDWQTSTTPGQWEFVDGRGNRVRRQYDWYQDGGAWPFEV